MVLREPKYTEEEKIYEQIYEVVCLFPNENLIINVNCNQIDPKNGHPVELAFSRAYNLHAKRCNIVYVSVMTADLSEVRSFGIRTVLRTLEKEGLENLLATMLSRDEEEDNQRIRNPQLEENKLTIPAIK